MKKYKSMMLLILLCTMVQMAWAWDGSGTSADPYLIKTSADWKQLSNEVGGGSNFSGLFFEMTADIDAQGISVGASDKPFSGTFSGGMHTLTYNRGTMDDANGVQPVDDYCAPFVRLDGATIRHLRVKGAVYSSHMHAAGIASLIDGSQATTISNCHVSSVLFAAKNLTEDASFGGLAGEVLSTCKASPVITGSSFTGKLDGWCTSSGGLVAFTSSKGITFEHCVFDPQNIAYIQGTPATFVRMAPGVESTFKECYYTQVFGTQQGEAVFSGIDMAADCTYEMLTEPTIDFDGHKYYQNGAQIRLTVPEGKAFAHWTTGGSCYISDPWQKDGIMEIRDVNRRPYLQYYATPIEAKQERTMDGTKYRYLSSDDYHLYLSDELCAKKGYYLDEEHWLVKMVGSTKVYVTAVTGWEPGKIPSDGAQIHNDLAGYFNDHTLTACIAPHAFEGCTELKTLYFKDTDANAYDAATQFDFAIGDYAFANCPNLTEVKMMQYTTKGTNHWEALKPAQVNRVGSNVFSGSPQARFSTDVTEYQNYLATATWKDYQNCVIVYNHTDVDMNVNGAKYSYMRNTAGNPLKNSSDDHNTLMETLRLWNADYEEFTASSLLANSSKNIWYTKVVGVDKGSLDNGTMRIYNDPGSVYNYKTIAIESLGESKDVTAIEFWQTNGRSENSQTDLKMVIRNGAFKGCDNLKEIRLFYYAQDGGDHWEALGPQDVIPGEDIFGLEEYEELDHSVTANNEAYQKALSKISNVRICVSTSRYQEFLDDPNWDPYLSLLDPQDGPGSQVKADFTKEGVTYGYMTSPGGIMQTSQTVSQDVSWWTVPRIAIEVALTAASLMDRSMSKKAAEELDFDGILDDLVDYSDYMNKDLEFLKEVKLAKDFFTREYEDGQFSILCVKNSEYQYEYIRLFCGEKVNKMHIKGADLQLLKDLNLITEENKVLNAKNLSRLIKDNILTPEDGEKACYALRRSIRWLEKATKKEIGADKAAIRKLIKKLPFNFPYEYDYKLPHITNEILKDAFANFKKTLPTAFERIFTGTGMPGHSQALFSAITVNSILANNLYGSGNYDADGMRQGMRQNILSNIHQVGMVGGGYIITTPQKNLAYHTYIKDVPNQTTVTLYTGTDEGGLNANTTTAAIGKDVFKNKNNVRTVNFHESEVTTNESVPMVLVIPDSIFAGTSVHTLDLRLQTKENGTQAMGPENFILAGNKTFEGVDTLNFHIIIDPSRKFDFLISESWAPYERYFTYESAAPKSRWNDYGSWYGLAYESGSVQKVHKAEGHKIEHTLVTEPDDAFLERHGGAVKLCNDIGIWNNYQLDAVVSKAFYGNKKVTTVNFTDLPDIATGTSYSGLDMTLQDSCFANSSLKYLEMLYLVTDGSNHIDLIKPSQVKIGRGVLDGTKAKIKMMPQQVAWFEADSAWAAYKDRFLPCVIQPADKGFKAVLKDATYFDRACTGGDVSTWSDYVDLSRVADQGFSWLSGKFTANKDDIYSLAEFKYFEGLGMESIRQDMFKDLTKMTSILLPSTIKRIQFNAFENCSALQEIELPAQVSEIWEDAFKGCTALKTIVVRSTTPAELQANALPKNSGMKIYVPAESLQAYLTAWAEYKDYIVSDASYKINKVVKLDTAGTLAEKLGLSVEWEYTGTKLVDDEPYRLNGQYTKYDSLTVSGPLNDLDLWVIRYMAGNNGYERGGGRATDGHLRYLNLYNADIRKDKNCKAHYLNEGIGISIKWMEIENDNELPEDLFKNCTALETVVLPKSLTSITSGIFEGCTALKRVAITGAVKEYDGWTYVFKHLFDNPLEELVLLTDQHATTTAKDPWGASIQQVYTYSSQTGDYMGDAGMINMAQSVMAPFNEDLVLKLLAIKDEFFPSDYLLRENVEKIFEQSAVQDFNDFNNFIQVKQLKNTFYGCGHLKRITLPSSITSIGKDAFAYCGSLDTIRVISAEPAELAADAFEYLPKDFRILVPRSYAKLYRSKWAQYADHINADDTYVSSDDIQTVTVTEPNTLHKALGLEITYENEGHNTMINSVRGDFSNIKKLKVVGPIGGFDIDLMKYLAGYAGWSLSRNYLGHLEYIDLYDASIRQANVASWPAAVNGEMKRWDGTHQPTHIRVYDDELPYHAFLRAYSLRTLILPKTCKKVKERALQECEGLETLVLGDDMEDFNWNALDDDAMLTRMYILAKKKPEISTQFAVWRWLCNNYNPTFDAFYVRPSQYQSYLDDVAYTGSSWQRTNNVSKGIFDDDESFCAFASHGAATQDELATITSVKGWFDNHKDVRNLEPLRYTCVDYLDKATMAPLTKLETIAMPMSLVEMEEGLFENARHLRAVDFLMCNSTDVITGLRNGGFAKYGIDTQQTLAYVPATYGEATETNVVVSNGSKLHAKTYRLVDSLDYFVPYEFEADMIENTRKLPASDVPYTVCLPYSMTLPRGAAAAYKLSQRDGNKLVFEEIPNSEELQAMHPYLLIVNEDLDVENYAFSLDSKSGAAQTIPASAGLRTEQDDAPGYSVRGTFRHIGNSEAADLGAYVLRNDGDWHPVTTANTKGEILPFRAYLLPSARNAGARIRMSLAGNGNTTGIDTIETVGRYGTHTYYDLQGRRIEPDNAKGVVIKDGRKIMVK